MAKIRWPDKDEPYALLHLALVSQPSLQNYYESVQLLTPHLRGDEWTQSCVGFYLNSIEGGLPRITYFASDTEPAALAASRISGRR